jgi:hypothetical protein
LTKRSSTSSMPSYSHRFSSAGCIDVFLTAYQPYLGLLPHAGYECIVILYALATAEIAAVRQQRGTVQGAQHMGNALVVRAVKLHG